MRMPTDQTATRLTDAQLRVINFLPAEDYFVDMPFESDLPLGTAWLGRTRLYERKIHEMKFRLAPLGRKLKGEILNG